VPATASDGVAGRGGIALPWLAAAVLALVAALPALFGHAPVALVLDRAGLVAGAWLPLITAHFVHADAGHLLWNLVPATLLLGIAEAGRLVSRRRLLSAAVLSMLAVDLWFMSGFGGFDRYCGLSGILVGIYSAVGVTVWRCQGSWLMPVLLSGAGLKTAWELLSGASFTGALDTAGGWLAAPHAHLAGLLAGCLAALAGPARQLLPVSGVRGRRRGS